MCYQFEKGLFKNLFASIKYAAESKKGKYSLDTYLDIIGEFTDKLIIQAEKDENLEYIGGECRVYPKMNTQSFLFHAKLYFRNQKGEHIEKEAERNLAMSRFTSETIEEIGNGKRFDINKPIDM